MKRFQAALGAALLLLTGGAGHAQEGAAEPVDLQSSQITRFALGSAETRFASLEFIGGLELSAQDRRFGQFSGLRFLSPGGAFIGVADHGYWFRGRIERDGDHVPVRVSDFSLQPMVDASGDVVDAKEDKDAEGLDVHDGIATVAFERDARIVEYAIGPDGMAGPLREIDFLVPRYELRYNQGFETVARAPDGGHLDGARIVVAERSIDTEGNIFAAIVEGPQRGIFKVRRSDDFDVTDGAFLPDGDLLLLERRFSVAQGVAMRLRRIEAASLVPGAVVDGTVLMQADLAYRIDNMEALDIWQREDGAAIVSLVSDDNQSFLQRTIYLEFRLID
jgi:hypothetical protein